MTTETRRGGRWRDYLGLDVQDRRYGDLNLLARWPEKQQAVVGHHEGHSGVCKNFRFRIHHLNSVDNGLLVFSHQQVRLRGPVLVGGEADSRHVTSQFGGGSRRLHKNKGGSERCVLPCVVGPAVIRGHRGRRLTVFQHRQGVQHNCLPRYHVHWGWVWGNARETIIKAMYAQTPSLQDGTRER